MTTEEFIEQFRFAVAVYDRRLRLLLESDQDRFKPATAVAIEHLKLCGLPIDRLARALEQFQGSSEDNQEYLLSALRFDFERVQEA